MIISQSICPMTYRHERNQREIFGIFFGSKYSFVHFKSQALQDLEEKKNNP